MTYHSLDEVPEKDVERAIDFMGAVSRLAPTRTAGGIANDIANDCLLRGDCRLTHAEFVRRTGTSRRSVDRALKSLLGNQMIARIGRSETGHWIYVACWSRGDEHKAWGKKFDQAWDQAKKTRQLKSFQPPAYPLPAAGAAHGQA